MCLGLRYLHSKNPCIVHCNLTPNNILLGGHLEAKITDIGTAKLLNSDKTTLNSMEASIPFLPPEALAKNPIYAPSFDVYLFGGVILYVVTQLWPKSVNQSQSNSDPDRFSEIVGNTADLKPLVFSCLDKNPENQPSVSRIFVTLKEAKDKYNLKCSDDNNPTEWSAQVSVEQLQSQEKQQQQQQQ